MVNVFGREFDGPNSIDDEFKAIAGVYLITAADGTIVDVGETQNLKERIPNHERRSCWNRHEGTNLWFNFELDEDSRIALEASIRNSEELPCGSR